MLRERKESASYLILVSQSLKFGLAYRFNSCRFISVFPSPPKSNLVNVVRKPLNESRGINDFRRLLFRFNDLLKHKETGEDYIDFPGSLQA